MIPMAKKKAAKTHSLKDAKHPVLVRKSTGERVMAQSELDQLQDKRDRISAQLEEVDAEILAYKKKRQAELMAELEGLGLSVPGAKSAAAASEKKATRQRDPNRPCPVCGETGHDARRHKGGRKSAGRATEEEEVPLPVAE
jgi:DNA repair exonuclease SbcCD ATPase subunit